MDIAIIEKSLTESPIMKYLQISLIVCLLLSFSFKAGAKETITIASNSDASPGWSEYSKHYGYIIHIATEAFASVGIQTQIKWYSSWKRAFDQAKHNEDDTTCCWFFVDEREKDFYYSDPVTEESQVFFHLKSYQFNWQSVDDLKDIQIGGNSGFHYGDAMEKAEASGNIMMDRARSYEQNLKKLLAGRIQIYPAATITAYEHLNNIFPQKTIELFTYNPKPLLTKQLHLLLPKKMPTQRAKRLITLFNQGLQLLRSDGRYDKIIKDAQKGFYKKMDKKWKP